MEIESQVFYNLQRDLSARGDAGPPGSPKQGGFDASRNVIGIKGHTIGPKYCIFRVWIPGRKKGCLIRPKKEGRVTPDSIGMYMKRIFPRALSARYVLAPKSLQNRVCAISIEGKRDA